MDLRGEMLCFSNEEQQLSGFPAEVPAHAADQLIYSLEDKRQAELARWAELRCSWLSHERAQANTAYNRALGIEQLIVELIPEALLAAGVTPDSAT